MDVYKENTLTLHFRCDELMNEPEVIKSVFEKIEKIAAKPGYRKDFTTDEINLIKDILTFL
jgi:hypothetical protein